MGQLLSFTQRESFKDYHTVVLCKAKNRYGQPFFAYVAVESSEKLHALFDAYDTNSSIDFAQFGEILEHGLGTEPPAEVKERMKELVEPA